MAHLDPERLTLAALEGEPLDATDLDHLDGCAQCRDEYEALSMVADLGRQTRDLRDLPAPPESVWAGIAAATAVAARPASIPTPTRFQPARPELARSDLKRPEPAPSGLARSGLARRRSPLNGAIPFGARSRPWWRPVALAAAAALVAVLATVGISTAVRDADSPAVTAQAALTAYGKTPPAAHGRASVLVLGGQYRLRLVVADLPSSGGYYEVWLIDPDTNEMISVGILGGQSSVDLPLPSTVDLSAYRLVDVSAEPLDGNPAHSGDSLLRGTLTS